MRIQYIVLFLWVICNLRSYGQADFFNYHTRDSQIGETGRGPILKGYLSGRLIFYNNTGLESRYKNPTWFLSGLPRLEWGNFKMPVHLNAGNRNNPLAQYYNKIGISPTYKWMTLHLGYNNVYYSPFTLGGRTFVGTAVELSPSFLRVGAIYGRFQNPQEERFDTDREMVIPSRFARRGYAFKLGIGKEENFVDLLYFHAQDDSTSIDSSTKGNTFPAQNTVIGLTSRQRLGRVLRFELDTGVSAFTRNQNSDTITLNNSFWADLFGRVITPRLSTQYHYALQGGLRLQLKNFGLEGRYRRIDTDYRSMGAWFLLNDVEDITISPRFSLFDRKFRLRARYGWQRNNLSGLKATNSFRQIGSVRLDIIPSRKLSLQFNFSNFHFNHTKEREWLSETLLVSRITNRFRVGIRYLLPGSRLHHIFSANCDYRQLDRDTETSNESIRSGGCALRYHLRLKQWGTACTSGLQYYKYQFPTRKMNMLSAQLGIDQSLFKQKLLAGYHLSYNLQFQDESSQDHLIWRHRFNIQYRLTHQLQLRIFGYLVQNRRAAVPPNITFTESIGSLELAYRF